MINVCHILPTAYLDKIPYLKQTKFHLILAHQILRDKDYVNFYRRQKDAFIIMDNSAYEYGEALDDTVLVKAIKIVVPNEFVIPDVLFDKNKTISRYYLFINKFPIRDRFRLMAVPQGKTFSEWLACYNFFNDKPEISTLGIGQIYSSLDLFGKRIPTEYVSGREYIFHYLHSHNLINSKKDYHLLGLSSVSPLKELRRLKKYTRIRSADTSHAYLISTKKYLFHPPQANYHNDNHFSWRKLSHLQMKSFLKYFIFPQHQAKPRFVLDFDERYQPQLSHEIKKNILLLSNAGK